MTKIETRNAKPVRPVDGAGAVRDFTDLVVWKLARELRQATYLLSRGLRQEDKFVLGSQMCRAAVSITANIAEGFGRFSYRENIQFCRQARGSAHELRDHFTTTMDCGLLTTDKWKELDALAQRVTQVLNGYIRSTQNLEEKRKTQK